MMKNTSVMINDEKYNIVMINYENPQQCHDQWCKPTSVMMNDKYVRINQETYIIITDKKTKSWLRKTLQERQDKC